MAAAPKKPTPTPAPVRADTKSKTRVSRPNPTKPAAMTFKSTKAKSTPIKSTQTPTGRHFKVGDRVLFDFGKREVEGTVTSTSGDRVHVDMHFADDEPTPGLFRENELRSA